MKKIILIVILLLIAVAGYVAVQKDVFGPGSGIGQCPWGTRLESRCTTSFPSTCSNICSDGSTPK